MKICIVGLQSQKFKISNKRILYYQSMSTKLGLNIAYVSLKKYSKLAKQLKDGNDYSPKQIKKLNAISTINK